MRVSNSLSDFAIQAGTFATAKAIGGCGSTTPAIRECVNGVVVNEYVYKTISASVIAALDAASLPHTVEGLYTLANYALGNHDNSPLGQHTEYGAALSDIQAAVAAINEGFDECRISMGWDKTPLVCELDDARFTGINGVATDAANKVSVSAFPNPFNDKIRFEIKSTVSGPATLEMYNMFGQKLKTVFKGNVFAGKGERVEYNVPSIQRTNMFYVLRVGATQVAGKLISAKQ